MPPEPPPSCTLAVEVAEEAGRLLLGYAGRLHDGDALRVATKSTAVDPVSEADEHAERLIAARIAAAFPDDGLLAEEGQTRQRGSSGRRWLVDPLDGTVNFLAGAPVWSVSIACEDDDGPLVGVVHQPHTQETSLAWRGGGAWRGEQRLTVSTADGLDAALLGTGFSYEPEVRTAQGAEITALLPRIRDIRRCGSAALDLVAVAQGQVDAYTEFGLHPWDWAAGTLLVTEAGGRVSVLPRQLAGHRRGQLVAGAPGVHDALVAWLEERP